MNHFPARLDTLSKMITTVVFFVLVVPFITIGQHYYSHHDPKMLLAPVGIVLVLSICALYRPTGYTLTNDGLQIHRALGTRTIPAATIESIIPITTTDLGGGIRTFGSGGAFGYLGLFWYRKMGHMTLYVTDRSKMLLVKLVNGKKLLISPDDTQAFLQLYQSLS